MIKTIVCVAALALPASEAICGDWVPAQAPGHPYFVGVQYAHDDAGSLIVVCDTREKLIRIIHTEPRANWKEGDTIGVTTKDEDGVGSGTSHGVVMSSTMVVVVNESTFDLWTMGNAKRLFIVSAGDYARIYPATNFKRATEPVLRACGDSWQSTTNAAERRNQPPTASEVFHLRGECVALGEKVLAVKVWTEVKSQISHYNPMDTRCYVMVTVRTDEFQNHALYDGQSQELLAMAEIGTRYNYASRDGVFIKGGGDFDKVCAYIDKSMEDQNLCDDLQSWWMMLRIVKKMKPVCDGRLCPEK